MYQPQKEHFTLLCVCGCYLVIGRCCADNWSAPGVWLRCHRALVTMETWSVAGGEGCHLGNGVIANKEDRDNTASATGCCLTQFRCT